MIGNLRFEAMYLPGGIPGGIQLNAGFGELGHRSRFNSASGTVNSATSVRVNSVEPDSV